MDINSVEMKNRSQTRERSDISHMWIKLVEIFINNDYVSYIHIEDDKHSGYNLLRIPYVAWLLTQRCLNTLKTSFQNIFSYGLALVSSDRHPQSHEPCIMINAVDNSFQHLNIMYAYIAIAICLATEHLHPWLCIHSMFIWL